MTRLGGRSGSGFGFGAPLFFDERNHAPMSNQVVSMRAESVETNGQPEATSLVANEHNTAPSPASGGVFMTDKPDATCVKPWQVIAFLWTVLVALFAYFVWPTQYRYEALNLKTNDVARDVLYRVDRFSGEVERVIDPWPGAGYESWQGSGSKAKSVSLKSSRP
jgi:hypothetical protein